MTTDIWILVSSLAKEQESRDSSALVRLDFDTRSRYTRTSFQHSTAIRFGSKSAIRDKSRYGKSIYGKSSYKRDKSKSVGTSSKIRTADQVSCVSDYKSVQTNQVEQLINKIAKKKSGKRLTKTFLEEFEKSPEGKNLFLSFGQCFSDCFFLGVCLYVFFFGLPTFFTQSKNALNKIW